MEGCSDSAHCGVHRAGFILVPWQFASKSLLMWFCFQSSELQLAVATCICVSIVIIDFTYRFLVICGSQIPFARD